MTEQCRTSSTSWYRDFKRVSLCDATGRRSGQDFDFTPLISFNGIRLQRVAKRTYRAEFRPSLLGLSARAASPGFSLILSLPSCSGDKEAEGILSEVGHGGARRHQRRSVQHEDSPGPAKWYDPPPPHTSYLPHSETFPCLVWIHQLQSRWNTTDLLSMRVRDLFWSCFDLGSTIGGAPGGEAAALRAR